MTAPRYDPVKQAIAVATAKAMVEAKRGSPPDDNHWEWGQKDDCDRTIAYQVTQGVTLQCWHRR